MSHTVRKREVIHHRRRRRRLLLLLPRLTLSAEVITPVEEAKHKEEEDEDEDEDEDEAEITTIATLALRRHPTEKELATK